MTHQGKPRGKKLATHQGAGLRCLVVGAGEAGRAIARDLRRTPDLGLAPIGFLDDNPQKLRRSVAGLPVLGSTAELVVIAKEHQIEVVVIAIPSMPASDIRRLGIAAAAAGASVRYLPTFVAALRDARLGDLRRLRVDLLLGRQEVHVVRSASSSVTSGRRVLVTGAGGSIGSELCRQIDSYGPAALYMLDHDESNLHRLQLQLSGEALLDSDALVVADIRDSRRIMQVFEKFRPEVVFHAAAHKHLPLLERHACEGVKSNVLGTFNMVEAAMATGVERFILISTDKAADPVSILGATKRLAEMILQANSGGATKFASVRFGNVLGSRGSFLSVLSEQIENGEAVTITHPDVTRFFMTVEEAVGLVIEAASMATSGEVFVLDMGEPVRIVDLVANYAAQMHLHTSALTIRYTGLRQGEKLQETLFSEREELLPTAHPKIWAISPGDKLHDLRPRLAGLFGVAETNYADEVRRELAELVPEFAPSAEPQMRLQVESLAAPYPDGF
jgi:FlaA1/EpsC-like NDP-sugar epimerase